MNIESVQSFCKSLPGTTESVKWEDHLCFCIGDKMYAVTSLSGHNSLSLKASPEDYESLIDTPHFISAPYLGRYKWVFTEDFTVLGDNELKHYIKNSYELIRSKLPKSVLKNLT